MGSWRQGLNRKNEHAPQGVVLHPEREKDSTELQFLKLVRRARAELDFEAKEVSDLLEAGRILEDATKDDEVRGELATYSAILAGMQASMKPLHAFAVCFAARERVRAHEAKLLELQKMIVRDEPKAAPSE